MKFSVTKRQLQGTGASRRLRGSGKVPGIIYGAGEPVMVEADHNEIFFALKKELFHSSILELSVDGEEQKVVLRDFQMHPWKQQALHFDFQRVNDTTRIRKKVPLHFINGEESPAVKLDSCIINHAINEIEIECQAARLPEHIDVDLGAAKKGDVFHARNIKLPRGVRIVRHGQSVIPIASVVEPERELSAEELAEKAAAAAAAAEAAAAKGKKKK